MRKPRGLTLLELIIVLAIIVTMIGLMFPAIQGTRERARETVCKNNLHQLNLAVGMFSSAHKMLPPVSQPGSVGGWMIEILPFMEQRNLADEYILGSPLSSVRTGLMHPPSIFRCPRRELLEDTPSNQVAPAHYVLVAPRGREYFSIFDAPIDFSSPWLQGPELDIARLRQSIGPHSKGFFYVQGGQQGLSFMLDGQNVQH